MDGPIKERDWKYMRTIHDEMLHALCARINKRASGIVTSGADDPHKLYLKLYKHIETSDDIIGECFNDWKRSRISAKIIALRVHKLMSDSHVEGLSDSAQAWLSKVETMHKEMADQD